MNNAQLLLATLLTLLASCTGESSRNPAANASTTPTTPQPVEPHKHVAPHGGTMIELGDHFANLEFVLNNKKGDLNAWVLDAHAQNPVRLPHLKFGLAVLLEDGTRFDLQLTPVESALTGEKAGDTSQFSVRDPRLVGLERFECFLAYINIKGRPIASIRFQFPSGELIGQGKKP